MPAAVLTKTLHLEIYREMKSMFSDFHLFESLVAEKLKQAILDTDRSPPNQKTTKKVVERYFHEDSFKTPEQKLVWEQMKVIFRSCYVLMESKKDHAKAVMWNDTATLLQHYPHFGYVDAQELNYLLRFRNMVKVALFLIPARLNKKTIINIAARLEGSQMEYITGGGQTAATDRRVDIYEKEGGVVAEERPPRVRALKEASPVSGKRKASSITFTAKTVKLVRMYSDDVRVLTRTPEEQLVDEEDNAMPVATPVLEPLTALPIGASRVLDSLPTTAYPLQEFKSATVLVRTASDSLDNFLSDQSADFWKGTIAGAGVYTYQEPLNDERDSGLNPMTLLRGFSGDMSNFSLSFSDDSRVLV